MSETHDFRVGRWGHAISMEWSQEDGRYKWMGHGLGLKKGDFILRRIHTSSGEKTGKFRIDECEYKNDPRDMFTIIVKYVGWPAGEEIVKLARKYPPKTINPKFSE